MQRAAKAKLNHLELFLPNLNVFEPLEGDHCRQLIVRSAIFLYNLTNEN